MSIKSIPSATLASSITALILAPQANAQVISNLDLGLSGIWIDTTDYNIEEWDIDGDGWSEFHLYGYPAQGGYSTTYGSYVSSGINEIQIFGVSNQAHLVVSASQMPNLGEGSSVGDHLGFTHSRVPVWANQLHEATGFTSGEAGYFGFRFDYGGTLAYGWAEVIFDLGPVDSSMEITRWAFESSGGSIMVGDMGTTAIPEPKTVAAGLGLLALGAAGIRRWRQNKRDVA